MKKINKKFMEKSVSNAKNFTIKDVMKMLNWSEKNIMQAIGQKKLNIASLDPIIIKPIMFFAFIFEFATRALETGNSIKKIADMINSDIDFTEEMIDRWILAAEILNPTEARTLH